jgi:hypothetical protein
MGALPWEARGTSWRRAADLAATGTALSLLRAIDLSTRLYDVMRLRGYQGQLRPTRALRPRWTDWPALLLATCLAGIGATARYAGF